MGSNITTTSLFSFWEVPDSRLYAFIHPFLELFPPRLSELVTMTPLLLLLSFLSGIVITASAQCPDYDAYSMQTHEPFSEGKYQLSYQRPTPECRKFNLSEVEDSIQEMKELVKDPDLFRLFENAFPNTLDTTVTWKGVSANDSAEEVCSSAPDSIEVSLMSLSSPSLLPETSWRCGFATVRIR